MYFWHSFIIITHSILINCLQNSSSLNYSNVALVNSVTKIDGEEVVFRVINGEPAKLGDAPFLVALMQNIDYRRKGLYQAFCGGTIVGPSKIVTAAHCVYVRKLSRCNAGKVSRGDMRRSAVVAGQLKTRAHFGMEGQWRQVASGTFPRSYRFPHRDIAVLRITRPWTFNSNVGQIPYAKVRTEYGGLVCQVYGHGRINSKVQSDILLKAKLKLLSMNACNRIHNRDFSKMICTSDRVSDVHKGDSGGPLVCTGTGDPSEDPSQGGLLVGVVSGKDINALDGSFFTRVSSFHKFITNRSSKNKFSLCFFVLLLISKY